MQINLIKGLWNISCELARLNLVSELGSKLEKIIINLY